MRKKICLTKTFYHHYKTPMANKVYRKLLVLAKPMLFARLLASDFPSENPRTQRCNFPYT